MRIKKVNKQTNQQNTDTNNNNIQEQIVGENSVIWIGNFDMLYTALEQISPAFLVFVW